MIRRLAALAFFVLLPGVAGASPVTILVDASYSMALKTMNGTRLEVLRDELALWLAEQPRESRYALLVAEHASTIDLRLPYPATAGQVLAAMDDLVPWGSVDLGASMERAGRLAASLATALGEPTATLVLVSDGEDISAVTGTTSIRLPDLVALTPVVLESQSPASIQGLLTRLSNRSPVPNPPEDSGRDATDEVRSAEPARDTPVDVERTNSSPPAGGPLGLIGAWARIARWLFLGGTLLGAAGVLQATSRHRRRVERVRAHNDAPPRITLEIRSSSGRSVASVDHYPATIGRGSTSMHEDLANIETDITFTLRDGSVVLSAPENVKVNGMGRTEHELGDRDQIRSGPVRIIVKEIARPKPLRLPRVRHRYYPVAPTAALLVTIVAFIVPTFLPAGTQSGPRAAGSTRTRLEATDTTTPLPADEDEGTARSGSSEGDGLAAWRRALKTEAPSSPTAPPTAPPARSISVQASRRAPMPRLALPRVVAPGEPLPDSDVDYLLIHAHPDDEALDFGGLLARLDAEGLTGAIMLLTDGNAGLDQYPWRETDATYPPYDLADADLAGVRIMEATEAIGWLGAEVFIRSGLPNHPYGSVVEQMTPEQVIEVWGGHDEVVGRIAAVITALRPELLLSPDVPGTAYEHFEHEATGIVVDAARTRLESQGESPVQVHLVSVDPLQPDGYQGLLEFSPWISASDTAAPRLRQLFALRAHRTQRDATVIGVETRMALAHEYYLLRSEARDSEVAAFLSSLLAPAAVDPRTPAP